MAVETINDLYLKFANKVGRSLETDRYFQYLFEMIQAGDNTLEQKYQVMHKVVDEAWLSIIEDTLDDINFIIDKPRRFIATKEEVVPVALARKITADSVRHLSQHTQFIASNENGEIQPTKVLNVSTEESFDLYENRFIYHLIQRLVTFIDKRTDVIFWSTGDETQNSLKFESKVDDAYEEISYKIEMLIKNRQSFAENDADNMGLFMRIDRVRRMVMALKNSSFCDIMAGCSKVRSPIQRTNLIMKEPHYKACYKLWQFLEQYDSVGYFIEVQDSALEFDEEYLYQMYTNLITNYAVFKSLLEPDKRNLMEVLHTKRRKVKPKFVKKIKEVIVDDYDLEDVEIRQVIIEEVTQAQLDAEAKLAEETQLRQQAEQTLAEMDDQMITLQQQVMNLTMMNQQAEMQADEERVAKEEAQAELAKEKEERAAEQEQAAAEVAKEKEAHAAEVAKEKEERATEREQAAAELSREKEAHAAEVAKEKEERAAEREQAAAELAREREVHLTELGAEREKHAAELSDANRRAEAAQKKAEQDIAKAQKNAEDLVERNQKQTKQILDDMKQQHQEELAEIRQKNTAEIAAIQMEKAELEKLLESIRQEREELQHELARQKESAQTRENELGNELLNVRNDLDETRKNAQEESERLEKQVILARQQAEEQVAEIRQKADNEISETKKNAVAEINEVKTQADSRITAAKKQADDEIRTARQQAQEDVLAAEQKAREDILAAQKQAEVEAENRIQKIQDQSNAEVKDLRKECEKKLADAKLEADRMIETANQAQKNAMKEKERVISENADLKKQLDDAFISREKREEQLAELERELQDTKELARKAQEKADANTLSKYIIHALEKRKKRDNGNGDGE